MGKKGNKARQTRRGMEAKISAQKYLQNLVENGQSQENIELQRAYGQAELEGDFLDDDDIKSYEHGTFVTGPSQLLLPAPEEGLEPAPETNAGMLENGIMDDGGLPEPVTSLKDRWIVWVKEDHKLEYPDLALEVHVTGDGFDEPAIAEWMIRSNCKRAENFLEADLVIFTGGSDVEPALYGHEPHTSTRFVVERDQMDLEVYWQCYLHGIPMFGICRGAQFLHVMNGGKLYQDIDGHHGEHKIYDVENRAVIERVSSVHHQSCMHNPEGMRVLATAGKSDKRIKYDDREGIKAFVEEVGSKPDIEAFFYPETACLGVQGHPEYKGYNAYSVWCLNLINRWIIENPDIDFTDCYRRLRPDILGMRDLAQKES